MKNYMDLSELAEELENVKCPSAIVEWTERMVYEATAYESSTVDIEKQVIEEEIEEYKQDKKEGYTSDIVEEQNILNKYLLKVLKKNKVDNIVVGRD